MRISLKLLLLFAALFAALFGTYKAIQEIADARSHSSANAGSRSEYIDETNQSQSIVVLNLSGEIQSAMVRGVNGLQFAKNAQGKDRMHWIAFGDRDAYKAFSPRDFPNVQEIGFWAFDQSELSLSKLMELKELRRLSFRAMSTDALAMLSTLPKFQNKVMVCLRMPDTSEMEHFPSLSGSGTLVVQSANPDEPPLEIIRERNPDWDVIYASYD